MRDRLSKERRSWNMSRIRGRDTTPEKRLRSLLHQLGYRFRLDDPNLPGRPDVVLARFKKAAVRPEELTVRRPDLGLRCMIVPVTKVQLRQDEDGVGCAIAKGARRGRVRA